MSKNLKTKIDEFVQKICAEPGASLEESLNPSHTKIKFGEYSITLQVCSYIHCSLSVRYKSSDLDTFYICDDDQAILITQIKKCISEHEQKRKKESEKRKMKNELIQNKVMTSIAKKLKKLGHKIRFMKGDSKYAEPTISWLSANGFTYHSVALQEDQIVFDFNNDGYTIVRSGDFDICVNVGYNSTDFDPVRLEKKLIDMILLTKQKFNEIRNINTDYEAEIAQMMKTCQNTTDVKTKNGY